MSAKATIDIVLSNGQQAGKTINELTAQSAKLAREVKKLEVGSEAWVKASDDFKLISAQLKNVKKEAFDTAAAQDYLNSMFADMVPYQKEFANLAKGVKGVGTALKATTSMAQLLKVALAATGIGLLIVALGSLVAWLSKTQKGMDFVSKVTASVGAIFNVVIERVATLGDGLVKLLSGDFAGAWDSMKKSVSGFGDELAKETKATWANTAAMQELNREQALMEVNKAKARAEIEKLKKAAEDQTKSESERLTAAQKAYEMEQAFLSQAISLQERRIKLIAEENAKKGITLTDEDKQAQFDAEIELANMQEESFTKQTELQNKVNELKKAGVEIGKSLLAEEKKTNEERLKALEAEQKAREEFIKKSIEAEFAAHEERKKLDADMLAGVKEEEQKKLDTRLEQLTRMNDAEQRMIDELFLTNQLTQEERDQMLYDAQVKAMQDRLTLLISAGKDTTAEYQNIYMELLRLNHEYETKKTDETKKEEDERKRVRQEGFAAVAGIAAGVASLLSAASKQSKKSLRILKAAQTAEVTINTIKEVSGIFSSTAGWGPAGWALAIAQATLATARGVGAVKRINSTDIKEEGGAYAEGGVVKGPSHQAGGIPFTVKGSGARHEMEGNEIILTKGVYQNPTLRKAASDLNVLGGGRSFALGGPVIRDRGMVSTGFTDSAIFSGVPNAIAGAGRSGEMDLRLTNELLAQIASYTRQEAEKPPIVMTEIEARLYELKDVRDDATF